MIIIYIVIGIVIWIAIDVIRELSGNGSMINPGKSTLNKPGNLERCSREMVGKSQKECRQILNKYRN